MGSLLVIMPPIRYFSIFLFTAVKPCPHCRRKRRQASLATLSPISAENGDSRRIRPAVAVFGDKLSPKSATIVASVDRL